MLNLYRRHREEGKCGGLHQVNSRSYEGDESRRGWKGCTCPIYASGTVAGRFVRKNLEASDWTTAKAKAAAIEAAGSWELPVQPAAAPAAPVTETPDTGSNGKPVQEALALWIAEHEKSSRPNTIKKYRWLAGKFQAFADQKGYPGIRRFGPGDIREFRNGWNVSVLTSSKLMSVVKGFFEFCLQNEWIERNPARLVKNPRGASGSDKRNEQKLPFSDDELALMLDACETKYAKRLIKWDRDVHHCGAINTVANYKYSWKGEDLADFIMVSCYTGLRISDVATFHIDRLKTDGHCHIRTTKNGAFVFSKLPGWLTERLYWRAGEYGPLIFGEHGTDDLNVVTDVWRRKLIRLWNLCGEWTAKPTPHRFRHTFARILLQTPGVGVRDVAELLGDTEDVVRRHYAAWVPERQLRLSTIMDKVAERMPEPNYLRKRAPARRRA